ncbi:MAG: TRAP transporter permease [Alphaproteobacteria bacterium]|nr:TRAP transporter permease [Alphaproteobacteria bacterium]
MNARLLRASQLAVTAIAVAMSLVHLYWAASIPPEALIFRGLHLAFAMTLVFLVFALRGAKRDGTPPWYDWLLVAAGLAVVGYVFANYGYFVNRIFYIDEMTVADQVAATLAILLVMDATRRVIGWALPITALVFVGHALLVARVEPMRFLDQMYMTTDGIFGPTLAVSASYVMPFVLLGAFMEKSGTGALFTDFALAITGHTAGGPGKVSVVSSSLFGTISGSAVANVMVDGPITIPLMKRAGFRPAFAAGVEATASTGGQIMPPVMGAAAFVMAEYLRVPYSQIVVWALIPAVLYFVAVFFAVHFEAKRVGLLGLPRSELPVLGKVLATRGHLFVPIVVVLVGMSLDYSAPLCALAGTLTCIPVALLRASTRGAITWRTPFEAMESGARDALSVAMACACAGIVIGSITLTGLGISFTQIVIGLSQNSLLLALMLTAVAGIVLGMGMPTTPAYIVMTALLVPAIVKLGVDAPAAHMFAFYFAVLSAITPPVALAVYAAASLAKSDLWTSGWEAVRIGAAGFVVPFMFVYEPALLMIGPWDQVLTALATATVGVVALAAGLYGYFAGTLLLWERGVVLAAALLLIKPGLETDLIGAALIAVVAALQVLRRRAARAA